MDLETATGLYAVDRGKQVHAPCKTSSSKNPQQSIIVDANLSEGVAGRRIAYLTKEGATMYSGACKHRLQYDLRPEGRFGVRVGTWKIDSLSGKGEEVCEELRKRMIDVCCL